MRALLAAYALFSVGAGVLLFYLPLHLFSLGGSLLEVALLTTISALVSALMSGAWGRLSDSVGKRKPFMIAGMAAMSLFFISLLAIGTKMGVLLALAAATALTCATEPSIQAYVTSLSPKEKGSAAGRLNAYNYAGISASALLGGFLYDSFGFSSLAILSALSAAAATLILLASFKEKIIIAAPSSARHAPIAESRPATGFWRVIMRLFPVYLFVFMFILAMAAFGPIASVYLTQLGNSRTVYGIAAFLSFVVGGLVSQKLGRMTDRHGRKIMLLAGGLAYAAVFVFLYFVKAPLPALLAWSVPIYPLGWIASMAVVGDGTREKDRGVGMGLLNSFKSLGLIAGSLAGGFLAGFGVESVLVFAMTVSAVCSLLALFSEF